MSVQANWFDTTDATTPSDSDPFAGYSGAAVEIEEETTPTEKVAIRDLGQDEDGNGSYMLADRFTCVSTVEELEHRLRELLKREGNCFDAGITCAIKDHPEMTCSACPFHEVGQDTRKSALCRLGKEQERILALLIAKRLDGSERVTRS